MHRTLTIKPTWRTYLTALLLTGIASLALPLVASALPNQGPIKHDGMDELIRNNAAYGDSFPNASRQMEYVVSYDDFTDILQSDILVYMPTQYGTIQIVNKDLCVEQAIQYQNSDVNYAPNMPGGTAVTNYRLIRPDGVAIDIDYGRWNYGAANTCPLTSISLTANAGNASNVQKEPGTNYYMYRVRANAVAGGSGGKFSNGFRIVAPAGSYVSQDSNTTADRFGIQTSYPVPSGQNPAEQNPPDPYRVYSDLDIPFGPDCSMTVQTSNRTFEIYDSDNQGNYDVQPRPFNVRIERFRRSDSAYLGSAPLSIVAGTATLIGSNAYEPTGGNQTTVRFAFTANRDEIYKLRVYRLYYNNTLQFKIPFDSFYFYRQCLLTTESTVRPTVTMSPAQLEAGETATVDASVQRIGSTAGVARVNFRRTVWYDANRDGQFGGGDRIPSWFFGGTEQTGVVTLQSGDSSFDFNPPVSGVADEAGRLCTRLLLSPANDFTNISTPNPAVTCREVGKKPKLHVSAGDVVVGGTFRNNGGCPIQTLSATNLQLRGSTTTIDASTYSSYTDYAANSLGSISVFGTNGVNPQTPPANNMSFGNESPLGYFYSGPGAPSNPTRARCINDPFAIFAPQANTPTGASNIDVFNTPAEGMLATANGTININSSQPLPPGRKRIIYAPNASLIMITGNITYANGPYNSVDDLPQLIIMSPARFVVQAGVTRLDGIYASKHDFQTCDSYPLLNTCTQQLSVQGAVIAGHRVVPYRTAGSESPNYNFKAEVFHLRPDALLNQVPGVGTPTTVRTVEQREVPPRF